MTVEADHASGSGGLSSLWYDKRNRAIILQIITVGIFIWFMYSIVNNTITNMESDNHWTNTRNRCTNSSSYSITTYTR